MQIPEDNISADSENSEDNAAFDLIYKKYHKFLWMEAAACLNDTSQAQDVVQEVFAIVWEKRSLDNVSQNAYKHYLLQCVRHKCFRINNNETNRRHKFKNYIYTKETYLEYQDPFVHSEIKNKIHSALDSLPDKAGRAFELVYIEQVEQKKAAEQLQISLQTLRNQIHGSLKKLREKLISTR